MGGTIPLLTLYAFMAWTRRNLTCVHGNKHWGNIEGEQFLNLPWVRQLVASLSPQRTGFIVGRVLPGEVFLQILRFCPRQDHATNAPSSYFIRLQPAFCNLSS